MSIILNTTVLSNFAAIGQLDLLRRIESYQFCHRQGPFASSPVSFTVVTLPSVLNCSVPLRT